MVKSAHSQHPQKPSIAGDAPVSLKTLAAHLGLSRGTISLVLNSAPGSEAIPAATKERISRAAKEFKYKPNYFARYLNIKRSYLIGVLATSLGEGYDSALLAGIERQLPQSEYVYFVASHLWSKTIIRRTLNTLTERGAEGLILINTDPTEFASDIPLITLGAGKTRKNVSRISIDNSSGARLVIQHLFELGHRRIAFICGHADSLDTKERWAGTLAAAAEFGLSVDPALTVQLERISKADLAGTEEGYEAAKILLKRKGKFTALFAFNDMSAVGALNAFKKAGVRVPQDVSVVGFDDISLASSTTPLLTTVRQPLVKMGELAAKNLLRQIEEKLLPLAETLVNPGSVCGIQQGECPLGNRFYLRTGRIDLPAVRLYSPRIRRFIAGSGLLPAKSSKARSVTRIRCCLINTAPSRAPSSPFFRQSSHSSTAQPG
jgi:LacI family transcriptional regulator